MGLDSEEAKAEYAKRGDLKQRRHNAKKNKRIAAEEVERLTELKRVKIKRDYANDLSDLHERLYAQKTRSNSGKRRVSPRERIESMRGAAAADENQDSAKEDKTFTMDEAAELVRRLTERNTHRPNCRCYACAVGGAVSHIKSVKTKPVRNTYSRSRSRSHSRSRSNSMGKSHAAKM